MVRTRSERCGADEVEAGTADVVKTLRSNRIGCHATMPKGTDALHAALLGPAWDRFFQLCINVFPFVTEGAAHA